MAHFLVGYRAFLHIDRIDVGLGLLHKSESSLIQFPERLEHIAHVRIDIAEPMQLQDVDHLPQAQGIPAHLYAWLHVSRQGMGLVQRDEARDPVGHHC